MAALRWAGAMAAAFGTLLPGGAGLQVELPNATSQVKVHVRTGNAPILPSGLLRTDAAGTTIAMDMLQSLHGVYGKCLNFIHIPKTAGTSLEEVSVQIPRSPLNSRIGARAFRAWGMHDDHLKCSNPYHFKRGPGCRFPQLPATQWGGQQQRCSLWHTPPGWDSQLAESYSECTTFCVVRDPVKRMVSEASFRLLNCNATQFEAFVKTSFSEMKNRVTANDCHLLPQSEYVFGGKILGEPGQYCQRVLKMENLAEDFAKLMEEFQIDAVLKHSDTFKHNCDVQLSQETKENILAMYGDDFTNFGYHL